MRTAMMMVVLALAGMVAQAIGAGHVAVLSDMEDLSVWEGPCESTPDCTEGKAAMLIPMGKGGDFTVKLKDFNAAGIQLSEFDVIKFDYKVVGGRLTLDHTIRQWPLLGGFMLNYYPLKDTFVYPPEWRQKVVHLWEAENIRGGFDTTNAMFEFGVYSLANDDAKDIRLYLDNVRFVKRPIVVDCDIDDRFLHFGVREDQPDGGLRYRYDLRVHNRTDQPREVRVAADAAGLKRFRLGALPAAKAIPAQGSEVFTLEISLAAAEHKTLKPLYFETCALTFDVAGLPDSDYRLELRPATPYKLGPHPCLATTPERVAAVREWIAKWGWAREAANQILKNADAALAVDPALPAARPRATEPADKICPDCGDKTRLHTVNDPRSLFRYQCLTCGKMLDNRFSPEYRHPRQFLDRDRACAALGRAWLTTGDPKYAARAAEHFRAARRVVPDYPIVRDDGHQAYPVLNSKIGGRIGTFWGDYDTLGIMGDVLDMIWDAGVLSPEEKRDYIERVMRPIVYNRLRLENYLVHRINQIGGAYALMADDAPMAAFLIESEFGFREHIASHVRADGVTYMTPGYQTMPSLLASLRRYDNAGLDLYTPAVRNFFTIWYEWTDPDGISVDLGDASWASCTSAYDMQFFEQGYGKFKDPRMAIPLQHRLYAACQAKPFPVWEDVPRSQATADVLFFGAENIPRGEPTMAKPSSDYSDYGLLVFNQGEGDKRLWLALPYGKPMGHGHHDKLHIEWWALGQKMTKKGGGYGSAPSGPFWKHPLLHNTLLVDQQDQKNVPGKLLEFRGSGPVQGAVIANEDMYPGTAVERMVMLYEGLVFLFDRLRSDQEHTYDFVYRNAGRMLPVEGLSPSGPVGSEKSARSSFLGEAEGYATLANLRRGPVKAPVRIDWDGLKTTNAGVRLYQWAGPASGAELIVGDIPFDQKWGLLCGDPEATYVKEQRPNRGNSAWQYRGPMLIVRKQGQTASFFTLLEPYRATQRVKAVEPLPLMIEGRPVSEDNGVAFRLVMDDGVHLVMMCPLTGVKEFGGATAREGFEAKRIGEREHHVEPM